MSSEQVASVLRQTSMHGQTIKFIIARPVHVPIIDIDLVSSNNSPDQLNQNCDVEQQEKIKNTIACLNQTSHPNSQCIIIKTSEIMDKNVDLQQKLNLEMNKNIKNDHSKLQIPDVYDTFTMNECNESLIIATNNEKTIKKNNDEKLEQEEMDAVRIFLLLFCISLNF
jgi:hypothetical protein